MEERELPVGCAEVPLGEVVDVLDSLRVPINTTEREARTAGKPQSALYPYYGATGQVGWIDDYIFSENLLLLGEDGVPFTDPLKRKAYRASGKFWVNNHAHVIKPLAGICDQAYLESFLNQYDYTGCVTGSTRLKLTQAAMRQIPVPLAPFTNNAALPPSSTPPSPLSTAAASGSMAWRRSSSAFARPCWRRPPRGS